MRSAEYIDGGAGRAHICGNGEGDVDQSCGSGGEPLDAGDAGGALRLRSWVGMIEGQLSRVVCASIGI